MSATAAISPPPFNHAIVFSGGSFRFGYYLGMFAAAVETGHQPDLIFASCGGAVAAGIIASFSDDISRKQALLSPACYEMYQRVKVDSHIRFSSTLSAAIKRYHTPHLIQQAPDLAKLALFNVANETTKPFFPYQATFDSNLEQAPQIAIIGAEVLHPAGTLVSSQQPLFAETIFCSQKLKTVLSKAEHINHSPLIRKGFQCETSTPLATAVRISIGDIYYLAPYIWQQKAYIGGMLNLMPYEYAHYCANSVTLELKQPYSPYTAVPVFKQMFGFNPNTRLKQLHDCNATYWCDTSDSHRILKPHQLQKRYTWWRNRLTVVPPKSYENYRQMMENQWQYGYQRGIECYQSHQPRQTRMRNANSLNTSEYFRRNIEAIR